MNEATARMILIPRRKYTLTHKSPAQRFNRRSVMTYLGDGQWDAASRRNPATALGMDHQHQHGPA